MTEPNDLRVVSPRLAAGELAVSDPPRHARGREHLSRSLHLFLISASQKARSVLFFPTSSREPTRMCTLACALPPSAPWRGPHGTRDVSVSGCRMYRACGVHRFHPRPYPRLDAGCWGDVWFAAHTFRNGTFDFSRVGGKFLYLALSPIPYILYPIPYTLCPKPYILYPIPYTLYPIPYTLYPIPYTLHPTPYTLYPIPYTLYSVPYTLYPIPYTLFPIPYTLYPIPHIPYTVYPITYTIYPIPYTLYPTPYILYPIPYILYRIPYSLYPIP